MAETIRVFVENEAGSATKHTYDETTLALIKTAEVARPYPYPYGFVLGTRSGDGDAVDCFIVTRQGLRSGDIVECVAVHLLEQIEDGEIDHKVLGVPAGSPAEIEEDVIAGIRRFILSVFSHISGKDMKLGALHGALEAERYINACRVR